MDVDEQKQEKSSSPFNLPGNDDFGSPQPHKAKVPRIDKDIDETDANIDNNHVTSIASRLVDIGQNKEMILNKSFLVAYELPESDEASGDGYYHYGIVVGNTRHAAAEEYYISRTSASTIPTIRVDYILTKKPTKSEAIIISAVAGLEAKKDKLQYSATDILRNARQVLKYQPGIFSAETLNDPNLSPEDWKKRYETIVKDQMSEILNVDPSRILSSIWRTTFIDDRDFNQMLPFLVKHCTSIKKLARVCNTYRVRKTQTMRLCTDPEIIDGDYSDFEHLLNKITGRDWQWYATNPNIYETSKEGEPKKNLKKGSKAAGKTQRQNDDDSDEENKEEEEDEPKTDGQPKVTRIIKKRNGGNKRKTKKIQFNSIDITSITTNYLTPLRSQPHIAALFCHFIKTHSSNSDVFPENDVISTTAARMETETGNFDWAAFYATVGNIPKFPSLITTTLCLKLKLIILHYCKE
uniref:Uncharacterized protein n=1 Tax=Panagrolaimus davidi TaxID=227884 RepID=A0A914QV15_9BILA